MLELRDITYRLGDRMLIDGANVTIPAGHRVGLVGRNGTGKTTLLDLISGERSPESGAITLQAGARIGRVAQEAPGGATSLIDTVLAADTERATLLADAETAADPLRIAEIHTRLADIGAHAAPARAAEILAGLGFSEADQQQPCSAYSGGWRMRVALAAALFTAPDVLLLDEPTNYLDLEGAIWLEGFIARYPHTVLIVSHERDFLNRAVDHILHLEHRKLTLYAGGYDRFERTRAERLALQAAQKKKQDAQRAHMEAFVERFRAKATKARQAQSRLKMLERMQPIAALVEESVAPITLPETEILSPPIVQIQGGVTGYDPDKPVLRRIDLRIDQDDRIAVLGRNGNGKSTLAKLLAGRLELSAGEIVRARKLRVGYFAQHQIEDLRPAETPVQHVVRLMPDAPESKLRAVLGGFGLTVEKADTPVAQLSGGEKARLLFLLVTRNAPHLLILDEPTNHLDVDTREALVHALNAYKGAVILVSHDTHLVNLVADRLWLVDGGRVERFDDDLDAYRRFILQKPANGSAAMGNGKDTASANAKKASRQDAAQKRAETAPLRKAVKSAEAEMERLSQAIDRLETKLADPALYERDPAQAAALAKDRADLQAALAKAEEQWLEASESLETALSGAG